MQVSAKTCGVRKTIGVSEKRPRLLDEEVLAEVRATAFTLFARTRSRRSPTDSFLPQSWQGARGASTAISLFRHLPQSLQHRPSKSLRLCSQAIVPM